jgi:DNA (cytosine-5)-methyltransferase 1
LYVSKFSEPKNPVGTVAELFAGVGGFRIGLARAGWTTLFSNQWEPSTKVQHASDVYVANFGPEGHSNEDIAKVLDQYDAGQIEVPKTTMLVGGFPCQDYSVAKSLSASRGLEGKKGVLWWEILRLVRKNQPEIVFLENVDRLLKSPSKQRGRDFAVMLRTLGDEGYTIEWRVVSASDYGFPQRRIRVFIVARRKTVPVDALAHLTKSGVLVRAFPATPIGPLSEVEIDADASRISEEFNLGGKISPFQTTGVYVGGSTHAYTMKVAADWSGPKQVLGDVLQPDSEVPAEYWVESSRLPEWEYLKGAKSIPRVNAASGLEYNYSEGKMAFPDLLDRPARTILTGEGGSTPSRFKHIIKTRTGYRRLTPVELERLNGFEDGWTATDSSGRAITDARRAFFMGNALVVGLVERVGRVLIDFH